MPRFSGGSESPAHEPDQGFLLTRAEIAALVSLTGNKALRFVDGGIGLIGMSDDIALGLQSLVSRSLINIDISDSTNISLGEFLQDFFQILNEREIAIEIRINSEDSAVQVSHWALQLKQRLAIVKSEVDGSSVKFWFALTDVRNKFRFINAMSRPQESSCESPPDQLASMSFDDYGRLFKALRDRDAMQVDQILGGLPVDAASKSEFGRIVKEGFRGIEVTRQERHQNLLEAERFCWIESERFGAWQVLLYPLEARVVFMTISNENLHASFEAVTGQRL